MARPLESILAELNNVYNPQRDVVNQQLQGLDPQQQAENQGLEAAKTDAFSQITDQANRRGLFYSGIPVQEEQRYTGSTFLPAVANLKAKYAQQRFNLQDTLAKITQDQYLKGQDIYQTEMNRDASSAAEAARLRAAQAGGVASPSFGFDPASLGGGGAGGQAGGGDPLATKADAAVRGLINTNDAGTITRTINAINASAIRGNTYDQAKLQLLRQYMPGWFKQLYIGPNVYQVNSGYINSLGQKGMLKNRL